MAVAADVCPCGEHNATAFDHSIGRRAMSTLETKQPSDLRYVGVDEEWEVQWWAIRFNVTPEELRSAVREHGNDARVIQERLEDASRKSFTNMGES